MDPRLLDAYLGELRFNQALAEEFARDHPEIAVRLAHGCGKYRRSLFRSAAKRQRAYFVRRRMFRSIRSSCTMDDLPVFRPIRARFDQLPARLTS
ncbi:hypothetical protein [Caballeronia sp. S22]|uniref:hypothetical protein n=1 Tax=Caballeronia sp. S22 TaxID=3137182 RepID=UPI003531346E